MKRPPNNMSPELTEQLGNATRPRQPYRVIPRVTKRDRTNMTFFMAVSTHTQLKQIALARNTSLQQLVAEAVDQWLANQIDPEPFKATDEVK